MCWKPGRTPAFGIYGAMLARQPLMGGLCCGSSLLSVERRVGWRSIRGRRLGLGDSRAVHNLKLGRSMLDLDRVSTTPDSASSARRNGGDNAIRKV